MGDGSLGKTVSGNINDISAFFLLVMLCGVAAILFVFSAVSLANGMKRVDLLEEALSAIAAGKKDLGVRKDLNSNGRMNRFDRWIERPLSVPGETREDAHRLFIRGAKPCPVVEGDGFPRGNQGPIAPAQW